MVVVVVGEGVVVVVVVVGVGVVVVVVGADAHVCVAGSQYPLQHGVFELQCFPSGVHVGGLAKAFSMPTRASSPAPAVPISVFSAWRREDELAKAFVKSSK